MFGSGECCKAVWQQLQENTTPPDWWYPRVWAGVIFGAAALWSLGQWGHSAMVVLIFIVAVVAYGGLALFSGAYFSYRTYLVVTLAGEVHMVNRQPQNLGPQPALLRPIIRLHRRQESVFDEILPVWVQVTRRYRHRAVELCTSLEFEHCLQGWKVESSEPSEQMIFTDPGGWRRVVHANAQGELVAVLNAIKDERSFADLEMAHREAIGQREQVVRSFCRSFLSLEAYLASTKGEVRGLPMGELRRVVEYLTPGTPNDGGADLATHRREAEFFPRVLVDNLRRRLDLKYGSKMRTGVDDPSRPAITQQGI